MANIRTTSKVFAVVFSAQKSLLAAQKTSALLNHYDPEQDRRGSRVLSFASMHICIYDKMDNFTFAPWEVELLKDSGYADMSESEKLVAIYLRELNIWWKYESPVFVYDEKDRPRVWTPDFYLPKLGMYVEVCGSENAGSYKYREEIYKKNEVPVIFVQVYKEERKWKRFLIMRIQEIEEMRHSGIMKMPQPL
jgi:hypothetical protein